MKIPVPSFLKSIRHTLSVVNGVFLLTGLLLVMVGIVVLITYSEYEELITNNFFTVPGFVIATGIIIFLTSILGFYGAISEKFYFLAVFTGLLLVVLVFEIAILIVAFQMDSNAARQIQSTMLESLAQYSTRWETTKLWDDLQLNFECCGVSGFGDYISNQIPVSCCHLDYGVVATFTCEITNAYPTGCAAALGEWLGYNAFVIAVSASVAAGLQVPTTAIAAWMTYRAKYHQAELES